DEDRRRIEAEREAGHEDPAVGRPDEPARRALRLQEAAAREVAERRRLRLLVLWLRRVGAELVLAQQAIELGVAELPQVLGLERRRLRSQPLLPPQLAELDRIDP